MSGLPIPAVVLATMVLLAGAAACVRVARPATRPASESPTRPVARSVTRTGSIADDAAGRRTALAVVAGFLVLLATSWVVLAGATVALVLTWGRLVRDRRADDERRRVEAIAKWLEDLRDVLRGSSIGAEEALEQVAGRPPEALRDPLARFLARRRQGFRVEEALADLADDLGHPTADAAIAAIRLVVGGGAGAGRLHPTVEALAEAARDEVRARERIDRTRAVYQGSMRRLIVIGAALIAYLRLAAGDLLDAYDTPTGQVVLLLPLTMWAGCIWWLRALCRYEQPARAGATR